MSTDTPKVATVTKTVTATPQRKESKATQFTETDREEEKPQAKKPEEKPKEPPKVKETTPSAKKTITQHGKDIFNIGLSSLVSAILAFQVGVHQAKTEVAPRYYDNKQQVVALTEEIGKKDEIIKKVAAEKVKIATENNELKKSTIGLVKKYYLQLQHPDGRYELRTGGTPSWRYNNPGKLLYGNFAKSAGAIGNDGPLAIFSTYEDGLAALETYLFQSDFGFKNLKLSELVTDFYSTTDGYNPKEILAYILKETGLKSSQTLMTMTVDDRAKLLEAMQYQDNYVPGNTVIYKDKAEFMESGY